MTTYTLGGPDNDSNMCGSADRLFDDVADIPVCPVCGYKTDIYFVNPSFRVKRRVYDLSSTYDCYNIASLKFKEACQRLGLSGVEFLSLPSDSEFLVIKPTSTTPFDSESRKTKFESLCAACGFFKEVAGATPAFLLSQPEKDFSGTDIIFGSGNARGRLLIASDRTKKLLTREKLTGLYFKETMHNNSLKPTSKSGAA